MSVMSQWWLFTGENVAVATCRTENQNSDVRSIFEQLNDGVSKGASLSFFLQAFSM